MRYRVAFFSRLSKPNATHISATQCFIYQKEYQQITLDERIIIEKQLVLRRTFSTIARHVLQQIYWSQHKYITNHFKTIEITAFGKQNHVA